MLYYAFLTVDFLAGVEAFGIVIWDCAQERATASLYPIRWWRTSQNISVMCEHASERLSKESQQNSNLTQGCVIFRFFNSPSLELKYIVSVERKGRFANFVINGMNQKWQIPKTLNDEWNDLEWPRIFSAFWTSLQSRSTVLHTLKQATSVALS